MNAPLLLYQKLNNREL